MALHLNDDIYYMILEQLDEHSDVSAFMKSSKSLRIHRLGLGRLLGMGVFIEDDKQLILLCKLLKKNFLDRSADAGQLRNLTISIKPPMDDSSEQWKLQGVPLLIPVLRCLTNLRSLEIKYCELLLGCDNQLMDAFAELTTLQTLRISGFGPITHSLVASLRSHLRAVHINCTYYTPGAFVHSDGPGIASALYMLRKHRDTLEQADIHIGDARTWSQGQELLTANDVFPHVHTLRLTGCCANRRKAIASAFPHVRKLGIHWTCADELLAAEELPLASLRMDHDNVPGNIVGPNPWKQLEYVHADVSSLYVHALECSVDRLDVALWDFDFVDVRRLCTSLQEIQPRRLVLQWDKLEVDESEACDVLKSWFEHLLWDLEEPAIRAITHLGLDIGITSFEVDLQAHIYMDAFSILLAGLPHVRFFFVRLRPDDQLPARKGVYEVGSDALSDEGLSSWAACSAAVSKPLECVSFAVLDRSVFLHISRDSQLLQVDMLRPESGMRCMETEGMLM